LKKSWINKYDILILIAALGIAVFVYAVFAVNNADQAAFVRISQNGNMAYFSLFENVRYEVYDNGHVNIIIIENGMVRMYEANCPSGVCARHRGIGRAGEIIVCLPHRVVVEVIGGAIREIDAVTR